MVVKFWNALRSGRVMAVVRARWQLRRCDFVGTRTRIAGRVQVNNFGTMRIGNNVNIRATHVPVELGTLPGGTLLIGDNTFINSGVSLCAQESVTIGKNCAIGNYTLIMDTDFHAIGDLTQSSAARPVIIEDNVWLAARVTILKGVRVGRGAVVAAGAVVTKDVAPYTIVAGVPARFLRSITPSPPSAGAAVEQNNSPERAAF